MEERKELKKLVVAVLRLHGEGLVAGQIYHEIKKSNESVLREEGVRGFKSFVRILATVPKIEREGPRPMTYKAKELNISKGI